MRHIARCSDASRYEKNVISIRDIPEVKNTEKALRDSEAKYHTISENMQDLFYQTDLEGTITMVNSAGIRISGYESPEDVIGRNIPDGIYADPNDREQFIAVLKEKRDCT